MIENFYLSRLEIQIIENDSLHGTLNQQPAEANVVIHNLSLLNCVFKHHLSVSSIIFSFASYNIFFYFFNLIVSSQN